MGFLVFCTVVIIFTSSLYQLRVQGIRFLKIDFDLSTRSVYRSSPYTIDGRHTSIACAKICLEDDYCKEFGYRKKDRTCVLFKTSGPARPLQTYTGFSYYVIVSNADTTCNSSALGETDGNWTVFQRRYNGQVGFSRGWKEYKNGFGCQSGEFWLGLEKIHELTKNNDHMLRIELNDIYGYTFDLEYTNFMVGDEASNYKLTVSGYTPVRMVFPSGKIVLNDNLLNIADSLAWHNGQPFTTIDRELDSEPIFHCSYSFKGAWWYAGCHHSNLNGLWGSTEYGHGIVWAHFRGHSQSMAATKMMISRK